MNPSRSLILYGWVTELDDVSRSHLFGDGVGEFFELSARPQQVKPLG